MVSAQASDCQLSYLLTLKLLHQDHIYKATQTFA